MIDRRKMIKWVKFISFLLYHTGIYALLHCLFDRNGVYIVFYHRLWDRDRSGFDHTFMVDCTNFEKHIRYFKDSYMVITMDEAAELLAGGCRPTKKYMAVTFDDGYRDNCTYGLEIFQRYGLKPTIYLTAGSIERQDFLWPDLVQHLILSSQKEEVTLDLFGRTENLSLKNNRDRERLADRLVSSLKSCSDDYRRWLIEQLKSSLEYAHNGSCSLMLDWSRIGSLLAAGVDIGGHTMNHPILSKIPGENLPAELLDSKLLIEKRINRPVRHFSYPNGKSRDFTGEVKKEAARHYVSAVTTISGINHEGADLFELKRIGLSYDMNLAELKVKILAAQIGQALHEWKQALKKPARGGRA